MKHKEHFINKDEHFIAGWYMPSSLCSSIYKYLIKNQDQLIDNNELTGENFRNYSFTRIEHLPRKLTEKYLKNLQSILELYLAKYTWSNDVSSFHLDDCVKAQLYKPGHYYSRWHCEYQGVHTFPNCYRHLTYLTYLNDSDGGTEFFYQKLSVKPEPGLTLIWPATWTHTHRGIPASNYKGIITGWYYFP